MTNKDQEAFDPHTVGDFFRGTYRTVRMFLPRSGVLARLSPPLVLKLPATRRQ